MDLANKIRNKAICSTISQISVIEVQLLSLLYCHNLSELSNVCYLCFMVIVEHENGSHSNHIGLESVEVLITERRSF